MNKVRISACVYLELDADAWAGEYGLDTAEEVKNDMDHLRRILFYSIKREARNLGTFTIEGLSLDSYTEITEE